MSLARFLNFNDGRNSCQRESLVEMKFIEQFKYNDLNIEIMKKSTSKETTSITKIKGCIRATFLTFAYI